MTGHGLAGADLYWWLALRRVAKGGVTRRGDRWLDRGREVPDYVTDALTDLRQRELVALVAEWAMLTDAGAAHFDQLCRMAFGLSAGQYMTIMVPPAADLDQEGGEK